MNNSVGKPLILIVDDEPTNSRLLARILMKDYSTVSVDNGKDALHVASLQPTPDLILLDIMMPGMDGYEVCRQLKADKRTNEIPIIFISAMDQAPSQIKGFELGAVEYITKPYDPSILKARIRSHTNMKRNRDHLQAMTLASINELDMVRRKIFRLKKPAGAFYIRFFLMAVFVITLSVWQYATETETHRLVIKNREVNIVENQKGILEQTLNGIFSDLKVITVSTHLYEMFGSHQQEVRNTLGDEFRKFSLYKKVYDQIRFLDESGKEVVKVNYNEGNPLITPEVQLQLKGQMYYFKDTFNLGKDGIFVSPFELNLEHGSIEIPPIILFGMPVFDSSGRKKGVIILNYLGENLLDKVGQIAKRKNSAAMLLNAQGYFLKSPDKEDEWEFMYKDRLEKTFEQKFGDAWHKILKNNKGQFKNSTGLFTFDTLYPWSEAEAPSSVALDPFSESERSFKAKGYMWKFVSHVKRQTLESGSDKLIKKLVTVDVIIIFILGFGMWVIASAGARRRVAEKSLKLSETRFSELFDRMGSGVVVYLPSEDMPGDFIIADLNRKTEYLEQLKKEDYIGCSATSIFQNVFEAGLTKVLKRVWESGRAEFFPADLLDEKKLKRCLEFYVYKLPSDELVAVYEDVTARRQAEAEAAFEYALNEASAKISTMLLSADSIENVSTVLIEEAARLTESKHGFTAYMEDGADELIMSGLTTDSKNACKNLTTNTDLRKEGRFLHQVTERLRPIMINTPQECRRQGPFIDDHIIITRMIAVPAIQGGELVGLVALANSDKPYDERSLKIIEHLASLYAIAVHQRKSMQQISYLAHHDPLTGLANRYLIADRLEQAIVASKRNNTITALLFLDLDNFKPINDMLGHNAGDYVLKEIAVRLTSVVRESDTVGRMGGDEFVIILNGLEVKAGSGKVAEKILEEIALPVMVEGKECFVGISIGISLFPDDAEDSQTLQRMADVAMYGVKAKDKNGYAFYEVY